MAIKFSIIIPNYNSEHHIIKLLDSIKAQTFRDYEVIIVDDMSTDNSPSIIENYIAGNELQDKFYFTQLTKKRYNGGTRNYGVDMADGDYILFADCDDWFTSNKCLEELNKVIMPDTELVRLSYSPCVDNYVGFVRLHENTLEDLVHSIFVAPWTKCIKRELFVPFPENTLIEDVVQHIAQLDVIQNFTYCEIPIMVWNRDNKDAISSETQKYDRDSKRYSSIYRNVADLIDLKVNHKYCKEEREKRIEWYLDKIHNQEESSIVRTG